MSTPGSVLSGDVAGDYGALGIPPDSDVSRLVSSNPLLQELADAAVDLRRRSPRGKDCQESYNLLTSDVDQLVAKVIRDSLGRKGEIHGRLLDILKGDIPSLIDEIGRFSRKLESRSLFKKVKQSVSTTNDLQKIEDYQQRLKKLRREFGALSLTSGSQQQSEVPQQRGPDADARQPCSEFAGADSTHSAPKGPHERRNAQPATSSTSEPPRLIPDIRSSDEATQPLGRQEARRVPQPKPYVSSPPSSGPLPSKVRPPPNPLDLPPRVHNLSPNPSYYMPGSTFNSVGGGEYNYTNNVNSYNDSSITQKSGANGQNFVGPPGSW